MTRQFFASATRKLAVVTVASIGVLGLQGHAAASQLSGDEIRQTIGGKTVELNTRWGGFPLTYSRGGAVTGDGRGLGLGRFFSPKETGKWWVSGNQLCQQFPTWYDGRRFCFTLIRSGENTLRWQRDDGRSGTARVRG